MSAPRGMGGTIILIHWNLAQEAMAVADTIIQQNKEEFGHDNEPQENDIPLLSKLFYIESGGKKRIRRQIEAKVLEGSAGVKKLSELAETGLFDQAMGSAEAASVKPESMELELLRQTEESLRRIPKSSRPSPGLLERKASRELNLYASSPRWNIRIRDSNFLIVPPSYQGG